jgi:hypothetical protein
MLPAAWDKRSVTALESTWREYEENDDSDGTRLQATRVRRNSHQRTASSRSTIEQRVCTRYEGISIAAAMGFVTKEKRSH